MKHSIKSIKGFSIGALDGHIGEVKEFYFDDASWTIRYLVVETGSWLSGRKVLISPHAVKGVNTEDKTIPVNLTKEQIKNSPDVDTEKTVSRQQELSLYDYYGWPYTDPIGLGFYGGFGYENMVDTRIPFEDQIALQKSKEEKGDPHLRSSKEVKSYTIHATDGEIGDVEDFIFDDVSWRIHFMVVDTGRWLPGKKVLISPKWIKEIKWETAEVVVDLTVEAVKNSPKYDHSLPFPDVYEVTLYEYYETQRQVGR
ncbi:PRC-barrel domain-containing protein [Pedobacter sp.]|uniref:PRC-barrel domain-containing protein n=1 Tax=Pedobacter sp. TaxID=1411316 RepID=UPI003D7F7055